MIRNLKKQKWFNLAAALALSIGLLTVFAQLMQEVHSGNTLLTDEKILRDINSTSSPFWDSFYVAVTVLGGFFFIAVLTACLVAALVRQRRNFLATFVLLALAGAGIINIALKALVGRERPGLWDQLILESSYSFPSGHAMASSMLALCIILILWRTKYRLVTIIGGILYVGFVGYSRMYLGIHYPSDIIGGWLVSCAWFMTVGTILYGHSWRKKRLHAALEEKD